MWATPRKPARGGSIDSRFSVTASSTHPDGIDDVESLTERLTSDFIWLTDVEGGAKGTPFQERENAFYGRCKVL